MCRIRICTKVGQTAEQLLGLFFKVDAISKLHCARMFGVTLTCSIRFSSCVAQTRWSSFRICSS